MTTTQLVERAPGVQIPPDDNEDDEFRRRDWLAAQWQLCPYLIVLEGGGACVILDGVGRPIIRDFFVGGTEILAPDAKIKSIGRPPVFIHNDFGLPPGRRARVIVTGYIETYKLAPELRRRRELLRRGELPGG